MVGLEGSLKITEPQNGWVGMEGSLKITEPQNGVEMLKSTGPNSDP